MKNLLNELENFKESSNIYKHIKNNIDIINGYNRQEKINIMTFAIETFKHYYKQELINYYHQKEQIKQVEKGSNKYQELETNIFYFNLLKLQLMELIKPIRLNKINKNKYMNELLGDK